jgi:arginine deiminase
MILIQQQDHAELREMLQDLSLDIVQLKSVAAQNIMEVPALMQSVQEVSTPGTSGFDALLI